MKLLCDEHVPPAVVNALQSEGFVVTTVAETVELGSSDFAVMEYATERGLVVLTNDSDFIDEDGHSGVLYYDDQGTSNRELVAAIRTLDDLLSENDLENETVYVPDGWS